MTMGRLGSSIWPRRRRRRRFSSRRGCLAASLGDSHQGVIDWTLEVLGVENNLEIESQHGRLPAADMTDIVVAPLAQDVREDEGPLPYIHHVLAALPLPCKLRFECRPFQTVLHRFLLFPSLSTFKRHRSVTTGACRTPGTIGFKDSSAPSKNTPSRRRERSPALPIANDLTRKGGKGHAESAPSGMKFRKRRPPEPCREIRDWRSGRIAGPRGLSGRRRGSAGRREPPSSCPFP